MNPLSDDTEILDITKKNITVLPDLTKFKYLIKLDCGNNQLTFLPTLPQNLKALLCSDNKLTFLHTLPQNLEVLHCNHNQLTSLPTLPQKFKSIRL